MTTRLAVIWRVGSKLGRTIYRNDVLVGMVDSPAIASEIVSRLNGLTGPESLTDNELIMARAIPREHSCGSGCVRCRAERSGLL
jgi:hypothetical protein